MHPQHDLGIQLWYLLKEHWKSILLLLEKLNGDYIGWGPALEGMGLTNSAGVHEYC